MVLRVMAKIHLQEIIAELLDPEIAEAKFHELDKVEDLEEVEDVPLYILEDDLS